jgi:ribosomal protein RSM22 (predicted rRNA methylase)
MRFECPPAIERCLRDAARAKLGDGALRPVALKRAVTDRSLAYTSERDRLAEVAKTTMDLAARALFFTIADIPKPMVALAELAHAGLLPEASPLRVLDVGAGVGAMTFGLAAFLAQHGDPERVIEATLIDNDGAALELAADALSRLPSEYPTVRTKLVERDATSNDFAAGQVDLVLAGTLLNELAPEAHVGVALQMLSALRADGAVIIIEPALRETSRALHQLRDSIIEQSAASIFAPCTRTIAPCPALADEDDWCHEDRPTVLPQAARSISQGTGLRQQGLKFSYLTMRSRSKALVVAPDGAEALRVVSRPQKLKGRRECFACGNRGRVKLRLLKRNRTTDNRAMEDARRGDVVTVFGADQVGDERLDVSKDMKVSLSRPAKNG